MRICVICIAYHLFLSCTIHNACSALPLDLDPDGQDLDPTGPYWSGSRWLRTRSWRSDPGNNALAFSRPFFLSLFLSFFWFIFVSNSDGLHPSNDGLQPNSDVLQPTSKPYETCLSIFLSFWYQFFALQSFLTLSAFFATSFALSGGFSY